MLVNLKLVVLLLSIFSVESYARSILIDRLLLKINDTAYTQRDMETYLFVKALHKKNEDIFVKDKNWNASLKIFKNDMLIYEEFHKLRYTLDAQVKLSEELQQILAKIESDEDLKKLTQRLCIAETKIEQVLHMISRIEQYKTDVKESVFELPNISESHRVSVLEKRNSVFFYKDAGVYLFIAPNAYKAKTL